jgi:hypothetical protein
VIAAADVGVHAGSEHLGDDAGRRSRAMNPAKKARMPIVDRIGRDLLGERGVHRSRIGRRARQGIRTDRRAYVSRDRTPRRPFANAADVVERLIERAVG